MVSIGIDFGTSNTGVAIHRNGVTNMLKYDNIGLKSLGSYIYFPPNNTTNPVIGALGKELFYQEQVKGRLIRGIKRALPKKSIARVKIYRQTFKIEDLVAIILKEVVRLLERDNLLNEQIEIYAGRPSVFSDERMDNDLALERLKKAYALAGLHNITFIEEPVAAAWYYRNELKANSKVLFVDIGGGTTDFSLVTYQGSGTNHITLHGTGGLAIAGQSIDGDIVYEKLGPALGRDKEYETYPGKRGTLSKNFYMALRDPDEIMRYIKPATFMEISYARNKNEDNVPYINLDFIFRQHLSTYLLDRAENAKIQLSALNDSTTVSIDKVPFPFNAQLQNTELPKLADHSLSAIQKSLTQFLNTTKPESNIIDYVVLTGGMSQSPVVQQAIKNIVPNAIYLTKSTDCIALGLAEWGYSSGTGMH
jgi:hypothetical chaperone protein